MRYILFIFSILTLVLLSGCVEKEVSEPARGSYRLRTAGELDELLAKLQDDPDNLSMLTSVWIYYTQTGQFDELISHATPIYDRAQGQGNELLQAYAGSYLAQSYLFIDRYDSMNHYLTETAPIVHMDESKFLLAINSNTEAIHAMRVEVDYTKALGHFKTALDITRESGNRTSEGILLCNIADIYHTRGDSTGIGYAREAYEIGRDSKDTYVLGYGTMFMATLLCMDKRFDEALAYADELLEISEQPGQQRHSLMARLIHGDIYAGKGDRRQAENYYIQALGYIDKAEADAVIKACLSYGNFLLDAGRYAQAKEIFSKGLAFSEDKLNNGNRHYLLKGLSQAFQGLGDESEALNYYKKYHACSDSAFNMQKERAFGSLLMRYEKATHQKEIQEKELSLMRATRNNYVTISILAVILILSGSVYVLYRRKNRMYRQLVEKHQQFLLRGAAIAEPVPEEAPGDASAETETDAEAVTETDASDVKLYRQMEELMDGQHIYRHNDLSLDKLAEMLGTNRAYISRAINRYTGNSFYGYINSRRIGEATQVLSDPSDDTPLKALSDHLGYNSMSAFYRSFQKETGVPPSKYREEVRRMHQRAKHD